MEEPLTILSLLQRAADKHRDNTIAFPACSRDRETRHITYAKLAEIAHENGRRIRKAGIVTVSQQVVVLYFEDAYDNIIWTWSVLAAGGVPAIHPPLSRNTNTFSEQLANIERLFGSPVVITKDETAQHFEKLGSKNLFTTSILEAKRNFLHDSDDALDGGACGPDSLAVLLFTSGSTGHSKAVEFSHRQLLSSVMAKERHHGLNSDMSFLSWTSFDHSVAFCELHLSAIRVGAHQVHVQADELTQEPGRFFELLSSHRISYTFAPNSFLAAACRAWPRLDRFVDAYDFSNLNTIMVGGEANRTAALHTAEEIFRDYGAPVGCVKAGYGLSETCSACVYNMAGTESDVIKGYTFASCGQPLSNGIELRIIDESMNEVRDGDSGRIQLRGDIVFKKYYNNPDATGACYTSDGWFDTGDLGRYDESASLCIIGRCKEIIILGGNNYSSFEIEQAVESSREAEVEISWTACFACWDEHNNTEGVVVLFNPKGDDTSDRPTLRKTIEAISQAVLLACLAPPFAIIPLPKAQLPKSTIGKLSRQKLKQSYEAGRFDAYRLPTLQSGAPRVPLSSKLQDTIASAIACETDFDVTQMHANTEIAHTGMSSIAYLRLKRRLEVALEGEMVKSIPLTSLLSARTIQDLEASLRLLFEDRAAYSPLMPLRKAGAKVPLFLLPPGGGESIMWMSLAKLMVDRPIYALRVRGLECGDTAFASFEEMLDTYQEAIQSVRPNGPYSLCGLCFGGIVAFELAKRFEAIGERVTLCAGLDVPPHVSRAMTRDAYKMFYIDMLAYHRIIPRDKIADVERRYGSTADAAIIDQILADYGTASLYECGLTEQRLRGWWQVSEFSNSIARTYVPRGSVSRYDLFWAAPGASMGVSDACWLQSLREWSDYTEELSMHPVNGDHFTMLDEEHIEYFYQTLERVLLKNEAV